MIYYEVLKVALMSLRAHPLRSFLTTLGIVIGVGSVIVMVSLGAGAQAEVEERISSLGTDLLRVQRGWGRRWGGGARMRSERLDIEDARALRDGLENVVAVVPEFEEDTQVEFENANVNTEIVGTWPEWIDVENRDVARGRFIDANEAATRRRVAVIGSEIVEELFRPGIDPVGATIRIRGVSFEVVGVFAESGAGQDNDLDEQIIIPLSTAHWRVFGGDRVSDITVKVGDEDRMLGAMVGIEAILRRTHRIPPDQDNDFRISRQTQFLEVLQESQQTFTLLLAGIAGVSLLVGGIGVMNIMLVSVSERTREIGIRKAIGARRFTIRLQFLIESALLAGLGGATGIALAAVAARVLEDRFDWQMQVPADAAILSFAFSALVGIVFGIYPAIRASRLDPIDALRFE